MGTMEQVYMDAARACGLKPGDRVRVTRKCESREAGWCNGWAKDMDELVGQTGVIPNDARIGATWGINVNFSDGYWDFPYFVLEKVEDEPVRAFKVGDYVRVLRAWKHNERGVDLCPPGERALNETIGKVGRIVGVGDNIYRVEFPAPISDWFGYPWFVLEPAEKPEPEFTPFQKVLVRDHDQAPWRCNFFSHKVDGKYFWPYICASNSWKYCIPYEGNEHLLGTTDSPKE